MDRRERHSWELRDDTGPILARCEAVPRRNSGDTVNHSATCGSLRIRRHFHLFAGFTRKWGRGTRP